MLKYPKFNSQKKMWIRDNITMDFVKFIIELVSNKINGRFPVDEDMECCLKAYKRKMQAVANNQIALSQRKKIIQQGGFLGTVVSILGSALISHLLSNL